MFSTLMQTTLPAPLDPRMLPQEVTALTTLKNAEVFIPVAVLIGGLVLLLFGWKAYKVVVVLNCMALGYLLGHLLGVSAKVELISGIICALVFGAISWPLMKYAVALCGGLVGAVAGMIVWTYFMPEHAQLSWAGGLAALILFGMLSFCLFKTNVIVFTCVEGAAMLVLGAAALLMRVSSWHDPIYNDLTHKPVLMPLLTVAVALLGVVFQQQQHGLVGHEGAPTAKPKGDKK